MSSDSQKLKESIENIKNIAMKPPIIPEIKIQNNEIMGFALDPEKKEITEVICIPLSKGTFHDIRSHFFHFLFIHQYRYVSQAAFAMRGRKTEPRCFF